MGYICHNIRTIWKYQIKHHQFNVRLTSEKSSVGKCQRTMHYALLGKNIKQSSKNEILWSTSVRHHARNIPSKLHQHLSYVKGGGVTLSLLNFLNVIINFPFWEPSIIILETLIKVKVTSFARTSFSYLAVKPSFDINSPWSLGYRGNYFTLGLVCSLYTASRKFQELAQTQASQGTNSRLGWEKPRDISVHSLVRMYGWLGSILVAKSNHIWFQQDKG